MEQNTLLHGVLPVLEPPSELGGLGVLTTRLHGFTVALRPAGRRDPRGVR
jgi:hypothetical protein